jgi:hypothetical protein
MMSGPAAAGAWLGGDEKNMTDQQPSPEQDLEAIWRQITDTVKQRILMPALWRAMEYGKPITVDEGEFVLGFAEEHVYDSHVLRDSRYKNVIEQGLESATGGPLSLRIIHGTTLDEWEIVKRQEQQAAAVVAQREARQAAQESTSSTWDGLSEQLVRRYAGLVNRPLSCVQAGFLDYCVGEIASVYGKFMPPGESLPETDLRSYSRVLERLADRLGVPASVIGYLVIERRRTMGGEPGS